MMTEENKLRFKLKTNELINVWQNFCQAHTQLYDLTCDEYMHLLESDIDSLESTLEKKNNLLEGISKLDNNRENILTELANLREKEKFIHLSDMIEELNSLGYSIESKQLNSFNALLLDIITKIQDQNKKNQLFLNKAILSLKDLRQSFSGKKNYNTYGADGTTKSNLTP